MSFIKSLKSSSSQLTSNSEGTGDPEPPKPIKVFSDFGDGACGEPEFAQRVFLDFTPDAKIDNEISQKKICDFWKFINNTPEIKNLMVKPERSDTTKPPTTSEVPDVNEENSLSMAKTACSMLEVVEKKELITSAFESRMTHSCYSMGSREYKENEDIQQKKRLQRVPIICRCTKICKPCPVKSHQDPPLSKVKQLCKELQEWEDKHPSSMAPPGHPPALQHCTINRQVFDS